MKIGRGKDGAAWHRRWRLWRVQFGYSMYLHRYPTASDRWVLNPFFIYDRKAK